ncbi:hypothetical protein DICPUDRAFT_159541 [Dictyostelium purpureum]|uniref:Uncharacterized protein n=1 Tax=Dictyostelium purpureum TaxID=5786 RepID=F1A4D7_DICPU|nr:uncharacterized protein DICPUDRAFT_159541 [Dictyostelium purpureum]EGC28942.1 hypothetical protein DICPUDRAFT_159541 [Dictyostelium purpureum]|eukprot:XP_003294533.1 hypothetical protein DICPUDRAFT_159541 [Dictyostelium purpureum]
MKIQEYQVSRLVWYIDGYRYQVGPLGICIMRFTKLSRKFKAIKYEDSSVKYQGCNQSNGGKIVVGSSDGKSIVRDCPTNSNEIRLGKY